MKKLTLIVSAIALLIGFSQCRKEVINPNTNNERIQITLNANYGGNGSKTTFDPENLENAFAWNASETEYINVGGSTSGYLGQLSNEGHEGTGNFSGNITTPDAGETLYFFYLGNGSHEGATTLDFSNQDGTKDNVTDYHIAIGSQSYSSGQTDFSATLNMAMAIARFDLSQFKSSTDAAETVYIHGDAVYATATIDYKNGTITGNALTDDNIGFINVGTATADKYVALIPSVTTSTTVKFESNTKTGSMTFLRGIKPASYYSNSGSALAPTLGTLPEGATPGLFTVAGEEVNGNKISTRMVRFSKGNLQYQANSTGATEPPYTPAWRFAPTQYTSIGNAAGNNVFDDTRATQEDWIDLFGWGTSGWTTSEYPNDHFMPYDYEGGASTYGPKNKYGSSLSLIGDYAHSDWGVHNAIGNDPSGTWRTLTGNTIGEWYYLFCTRVLSYNYVKATVNEIQGIIMFSDSYTNPDGVTYNNLNEIGNGGWTNNIITTQWSEIEAAGAVFMPNTGQITSASSTYSISNTDAGYYWSSTNYSSNKAYYFQLSKYSISFGNNNGDRNKCSAVRLVYDVQ